MGVDIDGLVNNAGVGPDLMLDVPTAEFMKATFDTNVTGTILFTEAVLNYINTGGQIIFLSFSSRSWELP